MSAVAGKAPEEFPEDELRVLLNRAVPQLPSPAQRMEGVRARAVRRRRRRTAALSVTAVAAAVALSLTLPGLLRPSGGGAPAGAAPAPVPRATATQHGTPAPVPTPTETSTEASTPTMDPYRQVRFPTLGSLSLRLPSTWSYREWKGDGFASTQKLTTAKAPCTQAMDGYCTPLAGRMPRGGVLLVLQPEHSLATADKVRSTRNVFSADVNKTCVLAGGTQSWAVLIADRGRPGSDLVVEATLCLARPTADETALAKNVLATASFT